MDVMTEGTLCIVERTASPLDGLIVSIRGISSQYANSTFGIFYIVGLPHDFEHESYPYSHIVLIGSCLRKL